MLFFKYIPGMYQGADHTGRRVLNLGGGGGGGGSPVQEQYVSTVPMQFMPQLERAIGRAEELSETPYQTYGGERLAAPVGGQRDVWKELRETKTPGQFGSATDLTTAAGIAALQAGQYDPSQFSAERVRGPRLQQFQMGPAERVGAERVGIRDIQAAQMAGPQGFGAEQAQQYMSPYMQQVTDVQKQAAVREAQIADQQARLGSARQGTYGGARQALATAERERGLLDRLSNIQATGSQAAFEQAQQQFERDRSAQMTAQMANLTNEQQARVQSEANRLQAAGMNQQQAMQAALANQQAGLTVGQQNLAARLGVQQLGAQTSLEAQRANQQAMMEAQRMAEQSRQFGAGLGLQGAQAATQAGATLGQIGTAQQQADLARMQAQEQAATRRQQMEQQRLDVAYQDFLAQQRAPYQQAEFFRNMMSGLPVGQAQTMYQAPQSATQNLMQLGLGGLGLYGAYGGFR